MINLTECYSLGESMPSTVANALRRIRSLAEKRGMYELAEHIDDAIFIVFSEAIKSEPRDYFAGFEPQAPSDGMITQAQNEQRIDTSGKWLS